MQTKKQQRPVGLILLIFVAFIALGMPDGLLGVGWPSIRTGFGIPLDSLGLLLFTAMVGYLTSSFISGELTRRWGVGKLLIISCVLTGTGLISYTLVQEWWMMVALGVVTGLGAGAIDSGLNAYVASHFGPGLMQWLHASYGIGVTTGPLIMTFALANFQNWRLGYLVVGGFQLVLAISFWISLPIWKNHAGSEAQTPETSSPKGPSLGTTLKQPRVWWSLALFFLYTGSEVTLGTWVYTLLTEGRGIDPELAGVFAGSYWATFTVGRILAGVVARKVRIQSLVKGCILLALFGAVMLWWNPVTWVSLAAVALIGLAIAPMFPGLVTGTAGRVGQEHANNAIGIQTAAAGLGGTALTSLVGVLARAYNLEFIPLALVGFLVCLFGVFLVNERNGVKAW
ncbi:MAG: MFS transporter [Anaerolineaceae bacterium]